MVIEGGAGVEVLVRWKNLSGKPARQKMSKGGLLPNVVDNDIIYGSFRVSRCVLRW